MGDGAQMVCGSRVATVWQLGNRTRVWCGSVCQWSSFDMGAV